MNDAESRHVVIAGGGQAAAQTVLSLRQWGHTGPVTLIGEEPFVPYQRPPLTKAYLKGEMAEERLFVKPAAWYEDNEVELVLGTRVTAIDRAANQVRIEHGGHVHYDCLVLATGSRPRKLSLPGGDLEGVYDLRGLADVERLRPHLIEGKRLVIVGAGYIGLEAAASARSLGLEVTVLEYAPRVLARVTSPLISDFYTAEHERKGVCIRTSAQVTALEGDANRVSSVTLANGDSVPADLVLIAVGIEPNAEIAAAAGLACDDGIVVDRDTRSSDPDIFAVGDCSHRPLVHYGREMRLESVHNAIEQGKIAAATILGRPRPAEDCPWFWSDQFDLKLQIAGLSEGFDESFVRGDPGTRRFAAFYFRDGRLIATDAVNSAAEFMVSKKIIAAGGQVDRERLADASVGIMEFMPAPKA